MVPFRRTPCIAFLTVLCITSFGCGDSGLTAAIKSDNTQRAKLIIESGANVNSSVGNLQSPLRTALLKENNEIFQLLLEKNADPNACSADGMSVVHLAAEKADLFWLKTAVRYGGNVNQINYGSPDRVGSTPIFYAISAENALAVSLLINSGADLNHTTANGVTVLQWAMLHHMFDSTMEMLKAGADPLGVNAGSESLISLYFNDV